MKNDRMNERIKELAEHANNDVSGNAFSMARYNEKFAELIVRDCLKQIYSRTKVAPGDYNWTDKDIGYNDGVSHAYNQVKKHFGLK